MIYKTVGTGGDYATWKDAWSYLNSLVGLSSDYTFEQISDVVENSAWSGWLPFEPNSYTVQLINGDPPNGNPNSGFTTTLNAIGTDLRFAFSATSPMPNNKGILIVDGLNIIANANVSTCLIVGGYLLSGSTIKNIIINGQDRNLYGLDCFNNTASYNIVKNCKIFRCGYSGLVVNPTLGDGTGSHDYPGRKILENNTVYNCGNASTGGILVGQVATLNVKLYTVRNTIICHTDSGPSSYIDYKTVGAEKNNAEFFYCADSDDTVPVHTGEIRDVVAADVFESIDSTSDEYLKLKRDGEKYLSAGYTPVKGIAPLTVKFTPTVDFEYGDVGTLANSGGVPTYATTDIEGNDRPGEDGLYSIGCHEFQFDWRID